MGEIEVVEIQNVNLKGALQGFADIRIGGLILRNFKIIRGENGALQVEYPTTTFRNSSGQIRYKPLVSCPAELMQKICVKILSAWTEGKEQYGPRRVQSC
jgi:DNA-binding cell septation regulator SpoVG